MRLFRRLLIITLILVLIVLIVAPYLIGLRIQKQLYVTSDLRSVNDNVDIRVTHYHRGWFSSDVSLVMKVTDADFKSLALTFGIAPQNIPSAIEIIFNQHIQHGPLFYSHLTQLPCILGLAAIDRHLVIPADQQKIFNAVGFNESVWQANESYVGFTGKLYEYIKLANYLMIAPNGNGHIHFNAMEGKVWQWPDSSRMKADVKIDDFSIEVDSSFISLPAISLNVDMQKDPHNLWIGSQTLFIPEVMLRNTLTDFIQINGVNVKNVMSEKDNLLDAKKSVEIQSVQYNEKTFGPIHLQSSAHRINAVAISDLIDTYKDISQHGELYESQMRQKLLSIVPALVTPGTNLQIESLDVATPSGKLEATANLAWPTENFFTPSDVPEMLDMPKLQGSMHVTKALANDLIGLIAKSIYIYQIPREDRYALLDMQDNINLLIKQNVNVILEVINAGYVEKADGKILLKMVRHIAPLDEYAQELKTLLFERKFSLGVSYYLYWQYLSLSQENDAIEKTLTNYETTTEDLMRSQLNHFIKAGYVSLDKNDYKVNLLREDGEVKLNGVLFKDSQP